MDYLYTFLLMIFPRADEKAVQIAVYATTAGFWILIAVLAAIGIHALAKNKGIAGLWRAWIPFYNLVVLGEIVGEVNLLGMKTKRIGQIAMVFQILYAVNFVFNECTYVFNDAFGFYEIQQQVVGEMSYEYLAPVGGGIAYVVLSNLFILLPNLFIAFSLYMEVFRSYLPSAAMALCILTIFFPFVAPIAVFCIRDRKYVNYREFLQKRMTMIYGVPQQPQERPKDPFSEFPDPDKENPYSQRPARPGAPQQEDPFAEFSGPDPYADPARKTDNGRAQSKKEDGNDPPPPADDDDLFN